MANKVKKTIVYEKLIRDNIPSIIHQDRKTYNIITLDQQSFLVELKKKLIEEAHELNNAESKLEIIGELADLSEVIDTLMKEYDIKSEELSTKKLEKRLKNGGFEKKLFLISVTELGDEEDE